MKRKVAQSKQRFGLTIAAATAAVLLTGCTLSLGSSLQIPAGMISSVGGWDLSACGGQGFSTCAALFVDNQQQFLNGSTAEEYINENAIGFLSSLSDTTIKFGTTTD